MWVFPHYVRERLGNALNSCMSADEKSVPIIFSGGNKDKRARRRLRPYSEAVNYLLKIYATDYAASEYDAATVLYLQLAHMTS